MITLIDCAPVPMILYNVERVIYANSAFKLFFGYNQHELCQLHIWDFVEESCQQEVKDAIHKRVRNNMPSKEYEFRMYTHSRELRWVHFVATTVLYEEEYVGFATFFDISEKKQLEEEKKQKDQLWTDIFNQHSAIMLLVDPDANGRIVDANPSAAYFYGYTIEQLKQMNISDINVLSQCEINQKMKEAKEHKNNEFIFEHCLSNGEVKHVQVFSTLIYSKGKKLLFSIIHDVTDRILYEQELIRKTYQLEESENRYRFITENSTDMIAQLTLDMTYSFVSSACFPLLGYEPDELIGINPLHSLIHSDDRQNIEKLQILSMDQFEITTITHRIQKKDGTYTWFETTVRTIVDKDGKFTGLLAVSRDTSQRKLAEEKLKQENQILEQFCFIDSLTGISNRRMFDEFVHRSWNEGKSLTLIMIDIDHFKKFNDTYGHQKGDDCLKRVAGALRKTLKRSQDFVARYGGEEFAVVLTGADEISAMFVAERLRYNVEALRIPHPTSKKSPCVTISLGVCHASEAIDVDDLIAKADQALYLAKRNGRNLAMMFDSSIVAETPFL